MTESELVKRITDMRDENKRYEKEVADLEKIVERLDAERNELRDVNADLEEDNRHLAARVKMLEHKREKLLDELRRVGRDKERDFMAGQLIAYRHVLRMILDRGKE